MSNVKELADAEALRAEAETPDTDEPEGDEPEGDEPEGDEPDTPATSDTPADAPDAEAMRKAVEVEARRHEKAFAKAVGMEPDELHVCEQCGGIGFIEGDEPEILSATFAEACPDCNGYGKVRSGSLNENTILIDCRRCTGYGYVNVPVEAPPLPAATTVNAPVPPVADDPEVEALRAKGYTVLPPYQAAQ